MPKRTNEDAPSNQPAAKRTSNVEADPQQELLIRAQASLDRLDYKTTEQICSEIIDSGKGDIVHPLMMRSISLGRRGQYCESVQDAENALKSKKSLETHLRAAFSYLGLVQHHLNLAKGFSIQGDSNEPRTDDSLLSKNVIELEESIQDARLLEKRGSFKRVSPELFTRIVAFCDSPSLAMAGATCKSWKDLISKDSELFRSFTMRGKGKNIVKGLGKYSQMSKDSIRSVKLEATNKWDKGEKSCLGFLLSRSKDTLRSLEVFHQGDLGAEVWKVAQKCKLSVLSSTLLAPSSDQTPNSNPQNQVVLGIEPTWQAQLEKLVWTDDSSSLVFDDALLSRLRHAKVVELGRSCQVGRKWIVNLLSSSGPSLVKVKISFMEDQTDEAIEIPTLHLPKLEVLSLPAVPREGDNFQDYEDTFLRALKVPSPLELRLDDLFSLEHLFAFEGENVVSFELGFQVPTYQSGQASAWDLVESLQHWDSLQEIHLKLEGRNATNFSTQFMALICPLSRESNGEPDLKDKLILPNLRKLKISHREESLQLSPSVNVLGCLVASRLAIARRVSPENVLWAAGNHFQASQEPPSEKNVNFPSSETQVCSPIDSVDISQTHADNRQVPNKFIPAIEWLESNLVEFKHPYGPLIQQYAESGVFPSQS